MKQILIAVLLLVVVISMMGCAKLVETKCETVDVTIVDQHYTAGWTQPIMAGKVISMIYHPATYGITVEYNGVEYYIGGFETYNTYKDRIGETVQGTLEIRTFDDGSTRYDIMSLG